MNPDWQRAAELIRQASHIVILQAENPDGDSLGSALALEESIGNLGKEVTLFCQVQTPQYLHYIPGWDRVTDELPRQFDLAIVVDASVANLLEKTLTPANIGLLNKTPLIIFDHHSGFNQEDHLEASLHTDIVAINEPTYVATGELLYEWLKDTDFSLTQPTAEFLAISILADSLGLMSEGTTARTLRVMSELVTHGANLATLETRRRALLKKPAEILAYKGRLLQRIEYFLDGQLAFVHIPWEEIAQYSDRYNPSMLVLDEMRLVEGVRLAAALKTYPDGKITVKLRSNPDGAVADKVAMHFGGGGHRYAAGFKIYGKTKEELMPAFIKEVGEHLAKTNSPSSEDC